MKKLASAVLAALTLGGAVLAATTPAGGFCRKPKEWTRMARNDDGALPGQ